MAERTSTERLDYIWDELSRRDTKELDLGEQRYYGMLLNVVLRQQAPDKSGEPEGGDEVDLS